MKILVKTGVRPRAPLIIAAAFNAASELGLPGNVVVTAVQNGRHKVGSKHDMADAVDFRTKGLTLAQQHQWRTNLLGRLGPDFQALVEDPTGPNAHLHVEYDPRNVPKRNTRGPTHPDLTSESVRHDR